MRIAVIGAGSWGTALAVLLSQKLHEVRLWGHRREHIELLVKERENKKYLQGILFPENLVPVHDLESAVNGASIIIMVVPSHSFREIFQKIRPLLKKGMRVVSAVKGIENNTLKTMTQVMEEIIGGSTARIEDIEIGVLSGPSFAEEVAKGVPTAVTLGFSDLRTAKELQEILVTDTLRIYTSRDIIGLEISAALKNIVAIAAGVCDGLGYGLNTRAALITRGLAEIKRLGIALGAETATFSGLSGLGDLILTCTGNLSRNRTVGLMLGQGKSIEDVKSEMKMVAEGIKTTKSVYDLAKKMNIEMPILEQTYSILYEGKKCSEAVKILLQRELKEE
ncbi:MAG: glycerol-3-phosphate dehydrogenase [Desulfobulbaceae bacterium BRH_c16a]|nr:MAG: glycerol-3-phosphate dehydrogenase [Desulfobulbaceae bacterium BRH_c16a]